RRLGFGLAQTGFNRDVPSFRNLDLRLVSDPAGKSSGVGKLLLQHAGTKAILPLGRWVISDGVEVSGRCFFQLVRAKSKPARHDYQRRVKRRCWFASRLT